MKKFATGMLVAGMSIMGVINSADAYDFGKDIYNLLGTTCPPGTITIPVTQTDSRAGVVWNMDSSSTSRDRCYAKVDSMYSDKYSVKWHDATASCTNAWNAQVQNVASWTRKIKGDWSSCDNIADYIQEEVGGRY